MTCKDMQSYKGRVWFQRDEAEPGLQFVYKRVLRTGLRPIRVGTKWKVPIITKWNIDLKWDAKSYEAIFIITGGGEYERTFELRYEDSLGPDFDYHRAGEQQPLAKFEQTVAWGEGEEEEQPQLPELLTDWQDDNLAIWVTDALVLQTTLRQAHLITSDPEGWFIPQGWVNLEITYYWKTLDVYEFEARRGKK